MGHLSGLGWLILLLAVVDTKAQKKPIDIRSTCLGNVMRIEVGPLGRTVLDVAAVVNNTFIPLTTSLASQCGFTMKMDHLDNGIIYASIQNCFAHNVGDATFTTTLNLRLRETQKFVDESVVTTCRYPAWASREIVCNQNYMEVSVKSALPGDYVLPEHHVSGLSKPRRSVEKLSMETESKITTLVFFTPEERVMKVTEARQRGYGIASTLSRLVLRSPLATPETYTQQVAGVPMTVLKASLIIEKKWFATQIDATAACPVLEGSVDFSTNVIRWYLPRKILPLISGNKFQLLEVHLGIDGQRLETAEIAARRYTITVKEMNIIIEIPVGAVGGYFKSHIQDGKYFTTYTIEPMVELVWAEETSHEDTKYKVLFPITTPLRAQPTQVIDNTRPEEKLFKVQFGSFISDVALQNIAFSKEVLSVKECSIRGINIHEKTSGSSKVITIEVPFMDRAVAKMKNQGIIIYALHLTLNLVVLPEFAPFSHSAYLEARLVDIVPPTISGECDYSNFYILVAYGTHRANFQTMVGKQIMSDKLAQQYDLKENRTHFSFAVPFRSPDVAYEAVEASSLRGRLDITLKNLATNKTINELSLTCNFLSTLTECFPDGTMTALAIKLETVPSLNPSQLTLSDTTCGPSYSDDRYAYFVFSGNSCGTTRKFLPNSMLYENEISLPDALERADKDEPEYELKVSCYYDINMAHAVAFQGSPRKNEPYAELARGELQIALRLATDNSYSTFHQEKPMVRFLAQPLYFEVGLMGATDPQVALGLDYCWATLTEDRQSQTRWNLIINGCPNPVDPYQVILHPVWADARVPYPAQVKRFEVQMFAFAKDQNNLSGQLFIHCDVMICDARSHSSACNVKCPNQRNMKVHRRSVPDVDNFKHVSLGPILLN